MKQHQHMQSKTNTKNETANLTYMSLLRTLRTSTYYTSYQLFFLKVTKLDRICLIHYWSHFTDGEINT